MLDLQGRRKKFEKYSLSGEEHRATAKTGSRARAMRAQSKPIDRKCQMKGQNPARLQEKWIKPSAPGKSRRKCEKRVLKKRRGRDKWKERKVGEKEGEGKRLKRYKKEEVEKIKKVGRFIRPRLRKR